MLRNALKFLAGAGVAAALWWYTIPAYNDLLARAALPLTAVDGRLEGLRAYGQGRNITSHGPDQPLVRIPAADLTFNVILFAGLFATTPWLLRGRGLAYLAAALAVLVLTHAASVAMSIETMYAARLAAWSDARYGELEQDLWTAVTFVYRLAGMYAAPFVLWFIATELAPRPTGSRARSRKRGR